MRRVSQPSRRFGILLVSGAALLFAGGGLVLGPAWAVAGFFLGPVVASLAYAIVSTHTQPQPDDLLRAGHTEEALEWFRQQLWLWRKMAQRWPGQFRQPLAYYLTIQSETLQAIGREPQALDVANEAVRIYVEIDASRPGSEPAGYAHALCQQARLLGGMSRHGEALGALEIAVRLYRGLAIANRGAYLPLLADALSRQADELGYLDRLAEARGASAEAALIRSDMLPAIPQP